MLQHARPKYCEIHKKAGMVDVMSAIYCKKHKLPGGVPVREATRPARSRASIAKSTSRDGQWGRYFARARRPRRDGKSPQETRSHSHRLDLVRSGLCLAPRAQRIGDGDGVACALRVERAEVRKLHSTLEPVVHGDDPTGRTRPRPAPYRQRRRMRA
jgi:hypothetical protein